MTHTHAARPRNVLLLSLAIAGGLVLSFASGPAADSQQKQEELTIRNASQRIIPYEIAPAVPGSLRIKKTIAPGDIHRFRGDKDQDIFFRSAGKELTYRLNSGRPYAFRYNENRSLDLYQASHGRTDVVDLAPFVPTPMPVVDRMLALAGVNRQSTVYDLGCGDGRIVIAAAQKFGARGVGIELDPELIRTARNKAVIAGVGRLVEFRMEDATRTDLRPATVVTLYLLPESNELLRDRLERQLRPGSVVVSHNYSITGWETKQVKLETLKTEDGQTHDIFVYRR
jgi:hypothetical protein